MRVPSIVGLQYNLKRPKFLITGRETSPMYRPNFCAECGEQIVRLKWRVWTSRRFCNICAVRFRSQQTKNLIAASVALLVTGFIVGRAGRPSAPPLLIERRAATLPNEKQASPAKLSEAPVNASTPTASPAAEEMVYMCGARTRKGTPCSRRVHGPVRCWQHKGMRPMLAQEKLLMKDQ